MEFVDKIKINRVNNVVLVSCSPATSGVYSADNAASGDDEIASAPSQSPNDLQSWSGKRLEGTLVLTSHHLLLSSTAEEREREEIWLLHSNIDVVEIRSPSVGGNPTAGSSAVVGGSGSSTPTQTRMTRSANSAASRIGAMASAVANQYNLAMQNSHGQTPSNASINDGDSSIGVPYDVSMVSAITTVAAVSMVTVPNFHILIRCKSLQTLRLSFKNPVEARKVYESLYELSTLPQTYTESLYPFYHRPTLEMVEDGWLMFELEQEYSRLVLSASDAWRPSRINHSFRVTPTYPRVVLVPKSIDDESILKIAKFRQHARFPVLSYFHKPSQMVILRSGQPLTGPNINRRCKEDERFLNAALPRNSRRGYVIDTRSPAAVKAAQAKGGGIEPEAHYPQWKKIHGCMERPQSLNESYSKMVEACADTSGGSFLSRVNDSGWLGHVKELLRLSCLVAQCVAQENACVLVHGTEGLDTTLQVTSLAQILLNHDNRTIRGFEALITREWLAFGHPFRDRHQRGPFAVASSVGGPGSGGGEAPSFLLFLDCVHQIHRHHPCAFEFTEEFLIEIFEHSYSSKFGTFLGNSEKDRTDRDFASRTVSLWSYLNHHTVLPPFINPLYEPNQNVIWASVAPQSLRVWYGLFCRWQLNLKPAQDMWTEVRSMKAKEQEARTEVLRLRKELAELVKEALNEGILDEGFPSGASIERANQIVA